MRILNEWSFQKIKLSVFHMNGRYSIKAEDNLMEQTYKFREGEFDSVESLKQHIDDAFYENIIQVFNRMNANRQETFLNANEDEAFDAII